MTAAQLIQQAHDARNNGQIGTAEAFYRQAIELRPLPEQHLECLHMLGVCAGMVCDYEEAARRYAYAAEFAIENEIGIGPIKRDEAIAFMNQGNQAVAYTLFEESLELLADGPADQAGITHIKWGYCFFLFGEPLRGETLIRDGLELAKENPFFYATGLIHLAEVAIGAGQYDRALAELEDARRIFGHAGNMWRTAEIYGLNAICFAHLQDRVEAEAALERAQQLIERAKMPPESKEHLARRLRFDETARSIGQLA